MRTIALLVLATLLLGLVPTGEAATVQSTGVFATARSGTVLWKANTTVEFQTLQVNANNLTWDGISFDFQPDTGKPITVNITAWGIDRKEFYINASTATHINVSIKNPGNAYNLVENGTITGTCAATLTFCTLVLSTVSVKKFQISFTSVTAGLNTGTTPPVVPPPASGGGGGGNSGGFSGTPLTQLPELPNPIKQFPQLNAAQWGGFAAGLVLVFNTSARAAGFLPALLRVPIPRHLARFLGFTLIALVYLTADAP